MPRIAEYTAPISTLNPSERGSAAWGQAGHRISSLYGAAASNAREAGALAAAVEKQKIWPFDILELYARKAAQIEAAAQADAREAAKAPEEKAAGGGGVRVSRGAAPERVARAAGRLGDALSDGGYAAASRDEKKKDAIYSTREEGTWGYDRYGNELVGSKEDVRAAEQVDWDGSSPPVNYYVSKSAAKQFADYQNWLTDRSTEAQKSALAVQDYWTRYNGGNPASTDQSGVSTTGPNVDFSGSGAAPDQWRPTEPDFTTRVGNAMRNAFSGIGGDASGDAAAIAARE